MTSQETKTTLKVLGDRALIKLLEQETKLKGGLILPETGKKARELGVVIGVGMIRDKNGNPLPFPVSVGDTVVLDKYSGQEVELDGEKFFLVKSGDIIAIVA